MFNVPACSTGHGAAVPGIFLERRKALAVAVPVQFGSGGLGQHGQNELDVGHVVAEIIPLQALNLLVFVDLQLKGALHDFVGQDGIFKAGPRAPLLPLIGQALADGDAPQPFVDPLLGIALLLKEVLHARHGEFGVFDLVDPLLADPGQPAFERLDLGRGNGLDDPEHGLGVGAIGEPHLAIRGSHLQPYDFFVRFSRTFASQLLLQIGPITLGDTALGQHLNDIDNGKPPFALVEHLANALAFKQGNLASFQVLLFHLLPPFVHRVSGSKT